MCAQIGPFAGCKIPLMDDLLKTSHWSSQDIFLEQYCNLRLFLTKSFFPPFFHGGQTCIAIWRFSLPPSPSLSVICHRHFIQFGEGWAFFQGNYRKKRVSKINLASHCQSHKRESHSKPTKSRQKVFGKSYRRSCVRGKRVRNEDIC